MAPSARRILKVALWCLCIGWGAYSLVTTTVYFALAPSMTLPTPAAGLKTDEDVIAVAFQAIAKSGENPDAFEPMPGKNGRHVRTQNDDPDSFVVLFKSKHGDFREIRVMLERDGPNVKCRVLSY